MSHPFDATLKAIVADHPADFAAVFRLPADKPVMPLNVDLSTVSAATDVALGFGDPIREIVDLNFQSGPDTGLAARLHLYNAALHARHDVAIWSILVLLRPKADAANLTGKLSYGEGHHRVEFNYQVIRLWQEPVESYLRAGLAALPLATLCQLPAERPLPDALWEVVREIERRLRAEANHGEAIRLMAAAYILTGLRVKKGELASIYKGIGLMQESTAYDEILEEGEVKRSHRLLLRQGHQRFGPPDAAIEGELTAIRDLDRLERMADAILTASSWQELLATP
jgi:predicted transposase YdaD